MTHVFQRISKTSSTNGKRSRLHVCVCVVSKLACYVCSLTKDVAQRPKFWQLVDHPYIKEVEKTVVDVAGWYADIVRQEEELKLAQGK